MADIILFLLFLLSLLSTITEQILLKTENEIYIVLK